MHLQLLIFLSVVLLSAEVSGEAVTFDIALNGGNAYIGYLSKNSATVELSPRLRAIVDQNVSSSGLICGFHAIGKADESQLFYVDLIDGLEGTGEIKLRENAYVDFSQNKDYVFHIEAFDCDKPRHTSKRILVQVVVRNQPEVTFTQEEYEFTTSTHIPVGSTVGYVSVVNAPINGDIYGPGVCGFAVQAGTMIPFSVDTRGAVRTTRVLTQNSPKSFRFQIQYTDCSISPGRICQALITVNVYHMKCQSSWRGMPAAIDISAKSVRPERLLWPPNFALNTCGLGRCSEPAMEAEVRLLSAIPNVPLVTASTPNCRQDPASLEKQEKLCAVNEATVKNLLPMSADGVKFPPEGSTASEMNAMHRLDTQQLVMAARAKLRLEGRGTYTVPEVLPSNLFERDFTLTFWLKRDVKAINEADTDYETVLCSQEDNPMIARALSISFKKCHIMVQMLTRDSMSNQVNRKAFRNYFFPKLPETLCSGDQWLNEDWHHYAISISIDPSIAEVQSGTLMIDGEDVSRITEINETIAFNRPTREFYAQFITIGSCLDPSTRRPQQHLHGHLTGFQLLIGQLEDKSISRCVAQCGETLLLPKANELLNDGGNVILNSDSITVVTDTMEQAIKLLGNIAYVRPEASAGRYDFASSHPLAREIEIRTTYACANDAPLNISVVRIPLTLEPSEIPRVDYPIVHTADLPGGSSWLPEAGVFPVNENGDTYHRKQTGFNGRPQESLVVRGIEVVTADIPVSEPGLPLFQELKFTLSSSTDSRSAERAASAVMLDSCSVMLISGWVLKTNAGERVNWPVSRVRALGLTGVEDEHGIRLKGRQTAGQYASLLHAFRYWPPNEIDLASSKLLSETGVISAPMFELICLYEASTEATKPFIVKILLRSSDLLKEPPAGGSFAVPARNQKYNAAYTNGDVEDYDDPEEEEEDDDEDEEEGNMPYDNDVKRLPPSSPYLEEVGPGKVVHYGQSNKVVLPASSRRLVEAGTKETDNLPASGVNVFGLSITLVVCAFAVVLLVVAFVARNTSMCRRFRPAFFGRGPHRAGGRVGRLELRPPNQFNFTENPIDRLENGQLAWSSDSRRHCATVDRLPGVHGGFTKASSVNGHADDDQFDAETRSFDGLFEEGDEDDGETVVYPQAELEEVDDFDESEVVNTQMIVVDAQMDGVGDAGVGDEEISDQEGENYETFGVGPSPLEFITLPGNKNKFQALDSEATNL